ncbi:hypothetical protein TNCV_2497411 [Trichonephila clavipes]|nr:hypothetical protein TNCV_2497411 [Trichonephila clavipes]
MLVKSVEVQSASFGVMWKYGDKSSIVFVTSSWFKITGSVANISVARVVSLNDRNLIYPLVISYKTILSSVQIPE